MLWHDRTSGKTEPNDHCNQAKERPEEFQIVIHSSKVCRLILPFSGRANLIKLAILTFDDRTRSVDRLMPAWRAESAAVVRCPSRRHFNNGCPTWIRTMNKGSKGLCVTVTPSGNESGIVSGGSTLLSIENSEAHAEASSNRAHMPKTGLNSSELRRSHSRT
jgi:hypothetical protein